MQKSNVFTNFCDVNILTNRLSNYSPFLTLYRPFDLINLKLIKIWHYSFELLVLFIQSIVKGSFKSFH